MILTKLYHYFSYFCELHYFKPEKATLTMKAYNNHLRGKRVSLGVKTASALLLLLFPASIQAAPQPKINLDSLCCCLDEAIDSSSLYIKVREQRINRLCGELKNETDLRERYRLSFNIFEEYKSFKNDSAVAYLNRCVDIAAGMGDHKRENDCRARLAFQCSTTGLYPESLEILGAVDTLSLDSEGMRNYLIASQHLYSEMSYYTSVPWLREKYNAASDWLLAQIFSRLNPDDDEYLLRLEMEHYKRNDFAGALRVNDRWLKNVDQGSHRYAIAAFYRFLVYSRMQNREETMRWLIESALSDVRNAVMDQGSLWELASRLSADYANLERSYKYIRFAWTAAQTFNTRIRSNQISPVLSLIESDYQKRIAKANMQLRLIVCVVCLLFAVATGLFFYVSRQRNKLQKARNLLNKSNNELRSLNLQLSETNGKLNVLNEKLAQTNIFLDESNKTKELYIGRFLSLCSTYIDKTETLRRNIQKRVKNKDYSGLARLATEKTDEWDDFYRNFDSAFLKLFPDFVNAFNALLRPEARFSVAENGVLGPSVRIFALIRLGIDDSSRIAEFLHLSVNTIYNYRAKVKNGALGDRNDFERKVKAIGMA